MADIQGGWSKELLAGTDGADNIRGGAGNDTLEGGAGDDILAGDAGNDLLSGGDGNDILYDSGKRGTLYGGSGDDYLDWHSRSGGVALLDGGVGNDFIYTSAGLGASANISVSGGEGADSIAVSGFGAEQHVRVDAGSGDDVVHVSVGAAVEVTLGAGADTLIVTGGRYGSASYPVPTVVEDYQPGTDVLHLGFDDGSVDWSNWSGSDNPFGSGYVRLLQRGADTVLQIDADGYGRTYGYTDVLQFRGIDASIFTAADFGGFSPDGSAPAGEVIVAEPAGSFVEGTVGPDRIDGMSGADTLKGFAGDDTIDGRDGNDWIEGGPGNDSLVGGAGDDWISDAIGSDTLVGGAGNDILSSGGASGEVALLDGGAGNDFLTFFGNSAATGTLRGGAGNDSIAASGWGSSLLLLVDAGEGDDILGIDAWMSTTVTLGAGADWIRIAEFDPDAPVVTTITDFEPGTDVAEMRWATDIEPYMWNWSGTGNPFGSGYARLLQQGPDAVVQIDADGSGSKYAYVEVLRLQNVSSLALSSADFSGYAPDGSMPVGRLVEGTTGPDMLAGTVGADLVLGGAGDDQIDGRAGDDTITGGDGRDFVGGNFGNDVLSGGDGVDYVIGSLGNDQLSGDDGDDFVDGGTGNDQLSGGEGNDTLFGGYGSDQLSSGDGNDFLHDWFGADWFGNNPYSMVDYKEYQSWSDWLTKDADSAWLDGGAGNDVIDLSLAWYVPGAHATILGGDGNDTISIVGGYSSQTSIVVDAGAGDDSVYLGSAVASSVTLGTGADAVTIGWGWADWGWQTHLDVSVINDFQPGVDSLEIDFESMDRWSGLSNPFYEGYVNLERDGVDTVVEMSFLGYGWHFLPALRFNGIDPSSFSAADFGGFTPTRGTTVEALYGSTWADQLTGTAADNRLVGRGGGDTLTGGAGADEFVFNHLPGMGSNRDIVTDFSHGEDKVVVDCLVFDMLAAGNLAVENFSSNSTGTARDADDYVVYNSVTGELSYDADGSGAGASVAIAVLASLPSLAAADFMVV